MIVDDGVQDEVELLVELGMPVLEGSVVEFDGVGQANAEPSSEAARRR